MEKVTAKNSTFEEYRKACPHFTSYANTRSKGYCDDGRYMQDDTYIDGNGCVGWLDEGCCFGNCPRMNRWRRIHKDDYKDD